MKNGSGMIGMDGARSGIERSRSNAQATRLIGSSASCMNVRSSPPKGLRSASATRRNAKLASMLLVCVAAIFVVSSVAMLPVGKVTALEPEAGPPAVNAPQPPYYVAGYTYDASGVTILPDCAIQIVNLDTAEVFLGVSSGVGFYMIDIANFGAEPSNYSVGDTVNVTATKDLAVGWNEAVLIPGGFTPVDIILNGVIPEFPMVVLPVVGLLAMVTIVSVRRRGKR